MESQHHQNTKRLRKLGIKHSPKDQVTLQPRIGPDHAEDLPTSGSVYNPDSPMFEMRQMDEMFEELWQNRRNHD